MSSINFRKLAGSTLPEHAIGDFREPNAVKYTVEITTHDKQNPNSHSVFNITIYGAAQQMETRLKDWLDKHFPENKYPRNRYHAMGKVTSGPSPIDQSSMYQIQIEE
jgi:hypothetical protein